MGGCRRVGVWGVECVVVRACGWVGGGGGRRVGMWVWELVFC